MNQRLKSLFEKPLISNKPFWENTNFKLFIYGTGSMAQSVYQVLTENGLFISGYLDHRTPANPFLNGLPVLKPESASGAIVIIGIHNRDAEITIIGERLKSLGAQRVIAPVELYDFFADALGIRYWLTRRDYYFSFKILIEEVDSIWSDDASRELYESIIKFRMTGDYSLLPKPDLTHQYFPDDIPAWKAPLRFVDCGAFDGDTLLNFQKANFPIEAVCAFEPDEENFHKLAQFVKMNQNYLPQVNLYPCGVFSSTKKLSFNSGFGEASAATFAGDSVVQCVSLDETIPAFNPNLIKMDIEGAEPDALLGARNLIATSRPGLAISIYHRPEHLWQIPLLVKDLAKGKYQYFLRAHGLNDFDIVLYAVPN